MSQLELTRAECRRLEVLLKAAPSIRVHRKVLALLAVNDGTPITRIAEVLRVHRVSIHHWVRVYTEARDPSALGDRYHGSRPASWSDEIATALQEALQQTPDAWGYKAVNWTSPLLSEHLEKVCQLKASERTVRRLLHDLDYVWKRPRHMLQDPKTPRVRRRLRLIRKKVRNLPKDCAKLFEDETDLLLFPPLRAGWFRRGKPAEVPISGENAKRTVFGTVDVETGNRILVAREGACACDFHPLLRMVRKEYGDKKVAILLDGASRHRAADSRKFAAEMDIELIWLPSRCTKINPMDLLWKWGKEKICSNKQYLSIDYQAKSFIEYLLSLSPQEALRKAGILSGNFWLFR